MQISALLFNYVPLLIGALSLQFIPMVSFCGASIILKHSDHELQQYEFLNQKEPPQKNINFLTADIQSRLDFIEKDINWLKTENTNQKAEIKNQKEEIKSQKEAIEHLLNLRDEAYSTNKTMSDIPFELSNKRTVRSVTCEPAEKKMNLADTSSTSWEKLEISNRVIGEMNYNTYTVKIYGHASNNDANKKNGEKKYYFEPIGQLDHLSAESAFNYVSKKYEMSFNVNMWDDTIKDAVHKFISDDLDLGPVNIHLVGVLPLDNVMVIYKATERQPSDFEFEQDSINYKRNKQLTFKFICHRQNPCDELATQMNSNPKQFRLKMRFSMSSQDSLTKETKISIESIMSGGMMNKLDQKYKGKEVVLLTADGKNDLIKESSENVIIEIFDDTQVPSQNSKYEIHRTIENMLEFSRANIERGDEKAWEKVFWNDDNYRPDHLARTLIDLHKKLDEENQQKLALAFTDTYNVDGEGGLRCEVETEAKLAADFCRGGTGSKENLETLLDEANDRVELDGVKFISGWGDEAKDKFVSDVSKGCIQGSISQEKLENLLDEAKDSVEWDGLKFVPKQMELYSMDVARLRDKKAFIDTYGYGYVNIWVSYRTSMLTIDVQNDFPHDPRTSSETLSLSRLTGAAQASYSEIVFPNNDGSSTKLVLVPTSNLNTPLLEKYTGTANVISLWNKDSIITTGSKSEIVKNNNWRIDQQGTNANGPDGMSRTGVTWANLQLQYGGTDDDSIENAKNMRRRGQSTSVAEVHAPVGIKFTVKAFMRAFSESMDRKRSGGVQVWMFRIEKTKKTTHRPKKTN